MKQIVLFNNKGGVGKTTCLQHLGFALEKKGKRVLFVDADPQCNLTSYICTSDQINSFWDKNQSIYSAVKPLIVGTGDIGDLVPYKIPNRNIWLVPGDLLLSDYEETLARNWVEVLAGREIGFRVTSSLYRLICKVSTANDIDYALIDVGPNLGSLNRAVLLGCDFFIVPLVPDMFSLRGLQNIGTTLKSWIRDWQGILDRKPSASSFAVQKGKPTFAGYINQHFNIYRGEETQAWKVWAEQVPGAIQNNVVDILKRIDTALVLDLNGNLHKLGDVKNYHSLVPLSQTQRTPIFELRPNVDVRGTHIKMVDKCKDDYESLANLVISKLV